MGERAGAGRTLASKSQPKPKQKTGQTVNAARFCCPADLAQFLVTLISHGASYTVQDDDSGWLVEITGV